MNNFRSVSLSILLFLSFINFISCQENNKGVKKINANEFEKEIKQTTNSIILDVRTPGEFSEGYIQNAVNIDWNSNSFTEEVNKLDKSKPVFVYCLAGGRSAAAASKLASLGFKQITELKGGMNAWRNAQKPLQNQQTKTSDNSNQLSIEQYNQTIKNNPFVIVDFYATWCGPCKIMAPYLQQIADENKDKITFIKIDSDQNQALVSNQNVEELPTLLFYKNGKKVNTHIGLISKEDLLKLIKSL